MTRVGLIRIAVVAAAVGALELACRLGFVKHQVIIPPSEMTNALYGLLASGVLNADIQRTLGIIAIVIVVSILLGFVLGLAIHALPRVREAIEPFFATYYAVPIFIFYPVLIAIFGLSPIPIVLIGVATAVVAMIIATLNGLDRVPPVLTKVARVHRLGRITTALTLQLPAAAPYLFTGVKLSVSYGFIAVIAAEFILSPAGLGRDISDAYTDFNNRRMYALILSLLVFALVLLVWQILHQIAGATALPAPLPTMTYLMHMVPTARFAENAVATLKAFALALVTAYAIGLAMGVWLGAHRLSGAVGEPILVVIYSLPKITLYPVVLLIFGLGISGKVVFGAMHGILPVALLTMGAIRAIPSVYLRSAQTLHLSAWQTITTVLLPAALPEVFTGLRIGFSVTLLGVLLGEMFASKLGLGSMIMADMSLAQSEDMVTVAIILFAFAAIANAVLIWFEHRLHRKA
jgi:ABC-type nitrate/sulfonate/bicarbonate transport system permease component